MNPLAQYLKQHGVRQATFAGWLGCSQGTVSKMCKDGAEIRDARKLEIERATGGAVPAEAWLRPVKMQSIAAAGSLRSRPDLGPKSGADSGDATPAPAERSAKVA